MDWLLLLPTNCSSPTSPVAFVGQRRFDSRSNLHTCDCPTAAPASLVPLLSHRHGPRCFSPVTTSTGVSVLQISIFFNVQNGSQHCSEDFINQGFVCGPGLNFEGKTDFHQASVSICVQPGEQNDAPRVFNSSRILAPT